MPRYNISELNSVMEYTDGPFLHTVSGVALVIASYLIINIALITHAWLGAGNKFTFSGWLAMCRGVFSSSRGPSR